MSKTFKLSVGVKSTDGQPIKELTINRGSANVERVYTQEKSTSSLYSWFADVISASVVAIGSTPVAKPFFDSEETGRMVPEIVTQIPLTDVGNLLLQIQRECWQDIIKDQTTVCKFCAESLTIPEVDLNKIEVPFDAESPIPENIRVKLGSTYIINTGVDALKDYEGKQYNVAVFRIPVLADAIRHEKVAQDEVLFWQNIAFDCLIGLEYEGEKAEQKEFISQQFITGRGKLLFRKDWDTKTLRAVRSGLQTSLPSAKMYYEQDCPCPKRRKIPYFVAPSDFFS